MSGTVLNFWQYGEKVVLSEGNASNFCYFLMVLNYSCLRALVGFAIFIFINYYPGAIA